MLDEIQRPAPLDPRAMQPPVEELASRSAQGALEECHGKLEAFLDETQRVGVSQCYGTLPLCCRAGSSSSSCCAREWQQQQGVKGMSGSFSSQDAGHAVLMLCLPNLHMGEGEESTVSSA